MVLVQEGEKLLDDRQDLLHQLVTALSLHDQLERDTEAQVRLSQHLESVSAPRVSI